MLVETTRTPVAYTHRFRLFQTRFQRLLLELFIASTRIAYNPNIWNSLICCGSKHEFSEHNSEQNADHFISGNSGKNVDTTTHALIVIRKTWCKWTLYENKAFPAPLKKRLAAAQILLHARRRIKTWTRLVCPHCQSSGWNEQFSNIWSNIQTFGSANQTTQQITIVVKKIFKTNLKNTIQSMRNGNICMCCGVVGTCTQNFWNIGYDASTIVKWAVHLVQGSARILLH